MTGTINVSQMATIDSVSKLNSILFEYLFGYLTVYVPNLADEKRSEAPGATICSRANTALINILTSEMCCTHQLADV